MPSHHVNKYMIVKTDKGYIRIDKDGNKFPITKNKKKRTLRKKKKKS